MVSSPHQPHKIHAILASFQKNSFICYLVIYSFFAPYHSPACLFWDFNPLLLNKVAPKVFLFISFRFLPEEPCNPNKSGIHHSSAYFVALFVTGKYQSRPYKTGRESYLPVCCECDIYIYVLSLLS
jgi:hypothetical protein